MLDQHNLRFLAAEALLSCAKLRPWACRCRPGRIVSIFPTPSKLTPRRRSLAFSAFSTRMPPASFVRLFC